MLEIVAIPLNIFLDIMSKSFALLAAAASIVICSPAAYSATTANTADSRVTSQISAAPEDAAAVYRRAMEKYEKNDLRGALADFDELIRLQPNFAGAYVSRANIKDDLGNPQGALEDYNKALSLDNQDYSAYFNRGVTYSRLERYTEAISDFKKSLTIKTDYAPAYRSMGMVKYISSKDKAGKLSGIEDVKKSIALYNAQGDNTKAEEAKAILKKMQEALG
jgi:tetratricopeptide (TPR) repeat protein